MRDWRGKRYWLVGASEGLGRELAFQLSRVGAEVIVSARSADRLQSLVKDLPGKASHVTVDVSDRASVEAAAAEAGDIDGMVYLAGIYDPMSAKDWDPAKVEQMVDINFAGCVRAIGAVLPGMVARDRGHIVLTGSLAGYRGLPHAIGYGASKAAIISLAETMRNDLQGTGVEVQLVNPGFIKSRLTEKNSFRMPQLMETDLAAREFFEHMNDDAFRKNYPVAFSTAIRALGLLPDWAYNRIVRG